MKYSRKLWTFCAGTTMVLVLLAAGSVASAQSNQARNVILFLGDGTGPATVHAASIHAHSQPHALYVHSMPHVGLMETSNASTWVSDSAAGITAIVTGHKTHNGVLSQSAEAQRGVRDGALLKTILEHSEERGLSTGVVTNSAASDATPAACYAHSNDRDRHGENFLQILEPRFGDGVDVVIGTGRERILKETRELGTDLPGALASNGYTYLEKPEDLAQLPVSTQRVAALFDTDTFDLQTAVDKALGILSRNPKGYFLLVESNNHFRDAKRSLDRMVAMDRVIQATAGKTKDSATLILFTADHSYDLRIPKGQKGQEVASMVKIDGTHTAEDVLVTAQGPGSDRVRGFFSNTHLFTIMMQAYGWLPADNADFPTTSR